MKPSTTEGSGPLSTAAAALQERRCVSEVYQTRINLQSIASGGFVHRAPRVQQDLRSLSTQLHCHMALTAKEQKKLQEETHRGATMEFH